ncbi:MAG: ABC transporter transmembrane domain-containing protein, partial [Acidimicrobiales bacterium]
MSDQVAGSTPRRASQATQREEEAPDKPPVAARGSFGGRMGAAGMPVEKSKDLKTSTRRLARRLSPERLGLVAVAGMALASVALSVIGPKILGQATDVIIAGLRHRGIDYNRLHRVLFLAAGAYVASAAFSYVQSYLLAGVVQRTMYRLRGDVESKLNRFPLRYVDNQPRGDLLSRVTNDIDNLAQSLQQTLSQLLTSLLTVVG